MGLGPSLLTGISSIGNGFFSHNTYAGCSVQMPWTAHRKSYLHRIRPMMSLTSAIANLLNLHQQHFRAVPCLIGVDPYACPMQFRGPTEKGCEACSLSVSYRSSVPSQRSGMKDLGSVKFADDRLAAKLLICTKVWHDTGQRGGGVKWTQNKEMWSHTPPGTHSPEITSP